MKTLSYMPSFVFASGNRNELKDVACLSISSLIDLITQILLFSIFGSLRLQNAT